jgi:hypothetical protein
VCAKELALQVNKLLSLIAEGINSSRMSIYRSTTVDITITDLRERIKTHCIPFVVADLKRYKVYLGLG